MERTQSIFQWSRWRSAFVCLLTYLSSASGALPELCALAASLDRSHTPLIGACGSEAVLVLSHSKDVLPRSEQVSQRHSFVTRCLCLLENQSAPQRDHRLEFASCGASESAQKGVRITLPITALPLAFEGALCSGAVASAAVHSIFDRGIIHQTASLVSTRTTVLLV